MGNEILKSQINYYELRNVKALEILRKLRVASKLLKVDKKQINSQKQQKNSQNLTILTVLLEAPPGIGPGIEVLQTFALPLGHGVFLHHVMHF